MTIESFLSIVASILAISGVIWSCYKRLKKKPMTQLLNELADESTSLKRQKQILQIINKRLSLYKRKITPAYINNFHSNGRSKLAIFYDICNKNDIEPTPEICKVLLGYDERKFRNEWVANHLKSDNMQSEQSQTKTRARIANSKEVIYLSANLSSRFANTSKQLTDILSKYNIPYEFLEGTKDIWCRDYMPVQTPSGKLIQFRYDPSYLKDAKYSDLRSDVQHVDMVNGIYPIFSDINLDGGNVVMFGNKAIVTDRIFSENPERSKESLIAELGRLLECEIIVIPAYKQEYDMTGHADGMIRFVDDNAVLVNNLEQDFVYMKKSIVKVLDNANLKYINFPWFEYKTPGHEDNGIGIYINYLEVGNLIVMPTFNVPGNNDAEALDKLKEVFPSKIIETIDCTDIAKEGGVLNCITWPFRK